jgi:cleavage stimulation factor subunit 3
MPLLNVPLWHEYTRFIEEIQNVNENNDSYELRNAFEFSLARLGQDIDSGPIWMDYLKLLLSSNISTSKKKVPEKNESIVIENTFRKCLTIPHSSLDEVLNLLEQLETQDSELQIASYQDKSHGRLKPKH